ncbi:MAG: Ppx/GppA family phosphatase [Nitrosomonadales bacterium]|nr:Ppx/GppA family phosphatase [Nitrosomonadales bacterium]
MQQPSVIAALDLGSNSFRLQLARVEGDQLTLIDGQRQPVRLAAGLDANNTLDEAAQQRALDCLRHFNSCLNGLPAAAVRVVGTNTLRIASNTADFMPKFEAALGYPIETIAGREEARLIYLGVSHGLPPSAERRLVIDIGGGSTEFIIGEGFIPLELESLRMGSVSYSLRYFPGGKITAINLATAEQAVRHELQTIAPRFVASQWETAHGSSGTAKVVNEILSQNGFSDSGITRSALECLRERLLAAGDVTALNIAGIKPDRVLALPGGFAILYTLFCELGIEQMRPAQGALQDGVLYDLLECARQVNLAN